MQYEQWLRLALLSRSKADSFVAAAQEHFNIACRRGEFSPLPQEGVTRPVSFTPSERDVDGSLTWRIMVQVSSIRSM